MPSLTAEQLKALIEIRITHAGGTLTTTPNDLIILCINGAIADLPPLSGAESAISGDLAVLYSTDEVDVKLSPHEITRLTFRSLSPAQFFALRDVVGNIYELQFYDGDNGWAIDPKVDNDGLPPEIRRISFGV